MASFLFLPLSHSYIVTSTTVDVDDTVSALITRNLEINISVVDSDDVFAAHIEIDSVYIEFFLNNSGGIIQFELLEISHPNFTKTYYTVRNATDGLTVTHENGDVIEYWYYPLKITSLGARGDLDQGFQISLGDLGEVLPTEVDAINSANGFNIKPTVKYRTYRSDNLLAPLFGPLIFEVQTFSFTREASTFEAKAPRLNINSTGELYKIDRFPTLRALL